MIDWLKRGSNLELRFLLWNSKADSKIKVFMDIHSYISGIKGINFETRIGFKNEYLYEKIKFRQMFWAISTNLVMKGLNSSHFFKMVKCE